jgi:hypothetical protein
LEKLSVNETLKLGQCFVFFDQLTFLLYNVILKPRDSKQENSFIKKKNKKNKQENSTTCYQQNKIK